MKSMKVFLLATLIFLAGCALPAGIGENENSNSLAPVSEQTTVDESEKISSEDLAGKTSKEKETLAITVYYQDREGDLIPVTRKVEKQVGIAKIAVNSLIDTSYTREELEYYGLYPVFPMGTQILGLNLKEGHVTVDFNEKLLDYETEAAEKSIITSLIYTLTEFKTIEKVTILVNGKKANKLKFNTDVSEPLGRTQILINSNKVNLDEGNQKLDIYLLKSANNKFSYFLPVSMQHTGANQDNLHQMIVFLSGDAIEKRFFTEVPTGTKLISSRVEGKVLKLDLSDKFGKGGGTAREDGMVKQVLYTAKQLDGIESVMFIIQGGSGYMTEGTDISRPIEIPHSINEFMDQEQ